LIWFNRWLLLKVDRQVLWGALVLVETLPPQFTLRSKYYATKTIWFREEINKRGITLLKIDTTEQLGDIFSKGLSQPTFEYLWSKIIGW